jgi:hypothetical protein
VLWEKIVNQNDIVNTYMEIRTSASIQDATAATIERFSVSPSLLVDAFNAAQLDMSRPEKEAELIRKHRNELLSLFSSQK